ncbi:MAG: hypothetical protein ACXVAI_06570, partial [Candidatus Limnocylindrales bacterium]
MADLPAGPLSGRTLPMFEPVGDHAHGPHEPITIALGGAGLGAFDDGRPTPLRRHPEWIRARLPAGENYHQLKGLMRSLTLNTVCEEARCPNIGECWHHGTATFMILGDVCTRACAYCAVAHGKPHELDRAEPARVADAIERMVLRHAVITSVDRDDLADGGAFIFAETIR